MDGRGRDPSPARAESGPVGDLGDPVVQVNHSESHASHEDAIAVRDRPVRRGLGPPRRSRGCDPGVRFVLVEGTRVPSLDVGVLVDDCKLDCVDEEKRPKRQAVRAKDGLIAMTHAPRGHDAADEFWHGLMMPERSHETVVPRHRYCPAVNYSSSFLAVAVVLVLTPGADFAVIVGNSVIGGRSHGMATVFGVSTAAAIHGLLVSVGVAEALVRSEPVFLTLEWFGVAYLAWLAAGSLVRAARGHYVARKRCALALAMGGLAARLAEQRDEPPRFSSSTGRCCRNSCLPPRHGGHGLFTLGRCPCSVLCGALSWWR